MTKLHSSSKIFHIDNQSVEGTIHAVCSPRRTAREGYLVHLLGDVLSESGGPMSSKQVPEIKQLPIPEQMKRLEKWVRGHMELFNHYRGCLYTGGLDYPNRTVSPTADLKQFDRFVGDVRVFRNALSVLHRDGCSAAAEALQSALHSRDRYERRVKLPFEDELPTEMEPMVMLMFEPSKMFSIMRWMSSDNFLQVAALCGEGRGNELTEETEVMARLLPSLKKHWLDRKLYPSSVYQGEVFEAIAEDILGAFGGMQEWFDARKYGSPVVALYTSGAATRVSDAPRREHIYVHDAYKGVAFAYLLRNARQQDVLARIPRQLQGKVATWQFEVYEKTWFGIPNHKVMLVPESELSSWQGIHKSSLSKGASAGHVAVYNPTEVFKTLPDGSPRNMETTIVLDNR